MICHRNMANAMRALLAYKNRPEGEPVQVQTNWSVIAANDNEPEIVAEMPIDRKRLVTPSIAEIMRNVASGIVERNNHGQITRIGKLRFSDGAQVEAGFKYGPGGDVAVTKMRMPAGAMLGCRDKLDRVLGGGDNPSELSASNSYFYEMFGVHQKKRLVAKKRAKRNGRDYTHAESKAALADAYASTPNPPPVKRYPTGLPSASDKVADNFLGMQKSRCADTGGRPWQDICTAIVDREIWAQALAELADEDLKTLDGLGSEKSYSAIGRRMGHDSWYSVEVGKRAVRRANDNLQKNLKKFAA